MNVSSEAVARRQSQEPLAASHPQRRLRGSQDRLSREETSSPVALGSLREDCSWQRSHERAGAQRFCRHHLFSGVLLKQ